MYGWTTLLSVIYNLPSNKTTSLDLLNSSAANAYISDDAFTQTDISITYLIPTYYAVSAVWFYCHYRGKPFTNKQHMEKISYSNKVLGVLAFSRLCKGVALDVISNHCNDILEFLSNPAKTTIKQILRMFLPFVIIILLEIIPLLILHNITTVNLFTSSSESDPSLS